ncbi:tartrate dehydrogenase/decarboxylase [Diplocarpon mali]|nr:tartrate dehydrogenase/decarboxylase [Diplocarpon mali]
MPDDGLTTLKKFDVIFLGAVGAPCTFRYTIPGTQSRFCNYEPGELDWIILRENSEGEYAGHGGRSHSNQSYEVATEVSIFNRHGVERIIRFALEIARGRPKKHLTVLTKSNAQRNGMVMRDSIAADVAKDFPGVEVDKMLLTYVISTDWPPGDVVVDAMTVRMTLKPESLDAIVAPIWQRIPYADILSHLAAALARSLGIAPTNNLDPTRDNPSMLWVLLKFLFFFQARSKRFEARFTFWTACGMLAWLGEKEAADNLEDIVEGVCEKGIMIQDLGGSATTIEVADAVCEAIEVKLGKAST